MKKLLMLMMLLVVGMSDVHMAPGKRGQDDAHLSEGGGSKKARSAIVAYAQRVVGEGAQRLKKWSWNLLGYLTRRAKPGSSSLEMAPGVFARLLPGGLQLDTLQELDLRNRGATAQDVAAIVQRCPALQKLNLGYCSGTAGFAALLPARFQLDRLQELVLSDTDATAGQVAVIVQNNAILKKLIENQV